MSERRIIIDSKGVADTASTGNHGCYVKYEEMQMVLVADSQGEISEASSVEFDTDEFPNGIVIIPDPDEGGLWVISADGPAAEGIALSFDQAYYMDLVGRIMEIRTGTYVTDRRDMFGFNTDILSRFQASQTDQANRLH